MTCKQPASIPLTSAAAACSSFGKYTSGTGGRFCDDASDREHGTDAAFLRQLNKFCADRKVFYRHPDRLKNDDVIRGAAACGVSNQHFAQVASRLPREATGFNGVIKIAGFVLTTLDAVADDEGRTPHGRRVDLGLLLPVRSDGTD